MKNFNLDNFIKPEVKKMVFYKTSSYSYKIKMDLNENPYSLSDALKKEVLIQIKKIALNRYPDPLANTLREKIARFLKIPSEQIVIGNGSDELIQNILLAFGRKTIKVLYPMPTFEMYGVIAKTIGLSTINISLNQAFDLEMKNLNDRREKKIIFIPYPNNPTGNCFSRNKIIELLKNLNNLVVIDEAYFEFSKKTFLQELFNFNNLIILRTMSKAFALAGIRIGYLISTPQITETIRKVRLPFSVNTISQTIATFLIENKKYFEQKIKKILKDKNYLLNELKNIKYIHPLLSEANFILFKTELSKDIIFDGLLKRGILIRKFENNSLLENYLRVTVGKEEENKIFIRAIKKIIGENE